MTDTTLEKKDEVTAVAGFPVAAGAAAVGALLASLLSDLNYSRELAMAIENYTDKKLHHPQFYIESGKVEDVPAEVTAGDADAVTASKTSGAARGSVGVISYDIENSDGTSKYKLAVLWSIPFGYATHQNLFNFALLDIGTATDSHLYTSMLASAAKAVSGEFEIQDKNKGFKVKGVMGTGGQAALDVHFKNYSDD